MNGNVRKSLNEISTATKTTFNDEEKTINLK